MGGCVCVWGGGSLGEGGALPALMSTYQVVELC